MMHYVLLLLLLLCFCLQVIDFSFEHCYTGVGVLRLFTTFGS